MNRHHIVVSAENNHYMAWQCKLFHYSCVSRLAVTPTFVVHESGDDWHPGFRDIVRAGGVVRCAPSYAVTAGGFLYRPRNTPGTLLHAAALCGDDGDAFIVLCDPDMLFVREPKFPATLSGAYYSYMRYEQEAVGVARERLSVTAAEVESRGRELCMGVPHVVPVRDAPRLAKAWLEAIDAFPLTIWEVSMYALGLAAVKLKLPIELTHMLGFNHEPDAPLAWDMIHYCCLNERWDKRSFMHEDTAPGVWEQHVEARRGTVLGEIMGQIREARAFYSRLDV